MAYPSETLFPSDELYPSDLDDEETGGLGASRRYIDTRRILEDDEDVLMLIVHFIEAVDNA
jgi:hypothetical protein